MKAKVKKLTSGATKKEFIMYSCSIYIPITILTLIILLFSPFSMVSVEKKAANHLEP